MKPMKKLLFSAVLFLLTAALLFGSVAQYVPVQVEAASSKEIKEELDELKKEQEELKKEKNELKAQINDNMSEMEKLVAQKDVIDVEIFLLGEQIDNMNLQLQTYNLLIADKQKELDAARARYDDLSARYKDRIREMEMYGKLSYWSVLAQANSFGDLLDRLSMISEIQLADERRMKELDEAAKEVEQAQAMLAEEKAALEEARAELDVAQAELEVKRQEADDLLAQLIAQGDEYETLMDALEEEINKSVEEIAKTEKEYNAAKKKEEAAALPSKPPAGAASAGWHMPIASYTRLSSPYGYRTHPVTGEKQSFHNGVDLAAPQGTNILAARGGTVTKVGHSSTNGFYVTINHGDGFSTSYLHMDGNEQTGRNTITVKVGQTVSAGQKIGECGTTGRSTGPHLHFTIYFNGKTINPAEYYRF